jgi:hypothetical protein
MYLVQCPAAKGLNFRPASPLAGWLTDIFGAEWTTTFSVVLATPWWGVLTKDGSLALFGVAFAFESELARNAEGIRSTQGFLGFFSSGAISPLTAELAAVSRNIQGVGCMSP